MNQSKKPVLYDNDGAADFIGVSRGTLPIWRCRGVGPAFIRCGRLIRYSEDDLIAYLEGQRVRPELALAEAR